MGSRGLYWGGAEAQARGVGQEGGPRTCPCNNRQWETAHGPLSPGSQRKGEGAAGRPLRHCLAEKLMPGGVAVEEDAEAGEGGRRGCGWQARMPPSSGVGQGASGGHVRRVPGQGI